MISKESKNKISEERKVKYYFTILAILIILIWFFCGIFYLISSEVFWSGLIGFIIGSSLIKLDKSQK